MAPIVRMNKMGSPPRVSEVPFGYQPQLPHLQPIVLHFGSMSGKSTIEAFWNACTFLECLEVVTIKSEKDGEEKKKGRTGAECK
jgi:hypothetical protein